MSLKVFDKFKKLFSLIKKHPIIFSFFSSLIWFIFRLMMTNSLIYFYIFLLICLGLIFQSFFSEELEENELNINKTDPSIHSEKNSQNNFRRNNKKNLIFIFVISLLTWSSAFLLLSLKCEKPTYIVETLDIPEELKNIGFTKDGISKMIIDDINRYTFRIGTSWAANKLFESHLDTPSLTITENYEKLNFHTLNPITSPTAPPLSINVKYAHFELSDLLNWISYSFSKKTLITIQCIKNYENNKNFNLHITLERTDSYPMGIDLSQNDSMERLVEDAAVSIIAELGAYESDDAIAEFNSGNILAHLGETAQAISHFQKAAKLKPELSDIYVNWGFLEADNNNYEQAITLFNQAISINNNGYAYHHLGMVYFLQGKSSEAINVFQQAISINPNNAYAYLGWGLVSLAQNNYDEAISKFKKVIEIDPGRFDAYANWGGALFQENKFQEAIEKSKTSLALNPDQPNIYINIGNSLCAWGGQFVNNGNKKDAHAKFEEAITNYKKCIDSNPNSFFAYFEWGHALLLNEEYSKAERALIKAIELNPDDSDSYWLLGDARKNEKQYSAAIKNFKKATEIQPRNIYALSDWIVTLFKQNKRKEAMELYEHVKKMGLDPTEINKPFYLNVK